MGKGLEQVSGEITGANRVANAAQGSAVAQERALAGGVEFAQQGLTAAQGVQQDVTARANAAIAAAQSPEELAALTSALGRQETALGRQARLFQSIDPAIMEASKQALQLLQGEEAKSLEPLKQNRQRQRQQLLDRLREQLGPGAETSTAGIQALNQFDQQTSEQLAGAQESSIGNLFGIAQTGAQGRSALNQGAQSLANIGGLFGNAAGRLSQAQLGGANAVLGAGQATQGGFANLIKAQQGLAAGAGSQFVGDQLKGQARMAQHQQGVELVSNIFGGGGGCFPSGTLVKMADGKEKIIEDIELGEELFMGGRVTRLLSGLAENADWYLYRDTQVTGSHAVKHKGQWIRIKDVDEAILLNKTEDFLYNLATEFHKIIIGDCIFSDMDEVDEYSLSYEDSLRAKNAS